MAAAADRLKATLKRYATQKAEAAAGAISTPNINA